MEPTDLTVRILKDIRDDIRGLREEQRAFREETAVRFEVIETTLRDLAEQLVFLGRGIKVAIETRSTADDRIEDLERRIAAVEKHLDT